jgi:opacity protein-like surface antigen
MMLMVPAVSLAIPPHPGPYFSAFIGSTVLQDSTAKTSDDFAKKFYNDRIEFDPGMDFGGTGGFDFGFVRLEGELSYKSAGMKEITDTSDGYRFGRVDGGVSSFSFMVNAFVDIHNESPVTPYLGGGAGFATLYLDRTYGVDARSGTPQRALLYQEDNDTVFAYQAGAGVEIALTPRLSLDVAYRFMGTTEGSFGREAPTITKLTFMSHNAPVGLRVRLW